MLLCQFRFGPKEAAWQNSVQRWRWHCSADAALWRPAPFWQLGGIANLKAELLCGGLQGMRERNFRLAPCHVKGFPNNNFEYRIREFGSYVGVSGYTNCQVRGFCFQPTAKDARNIKKTEPGDIGLGLWRSKGATR